MIKYIVSVIFVLVSFFCFSQNYGDKDFYLIDSLDLGELTEIEKQLFDSCLTVFHEEKDDTNKVAAIEYLIEFSSHELSYFNYNKFIYSFVKNKLKVKNSVKIEKVLLSSLACSGNNIGVCYDFLGDTKNAFLFYNEALAYYLQIGDKDGEAMVINNLGYIYNMQGDIAKALEYYHKTLKIREEIKDEEGISLALNNIGYIHDLQGNTSEALIYYSKSLEISEKINSLEDIAITLNNIGTIYADSSSELEMEYYSRALKIRRQSGDDIGVSHSLGNIGVAFHEMADNDSLSAPEQKVLYFEALKNLEEALDIMEAIGDKYGSAHVLVSLGGVMLDLGNYKKAKHFFDKGLKRAETYGYLEILKDASFGLYSLSEIQGNGSEALEKYKTFIVLRDSLNNKEILKETIKQDARHEYEKQKTIDDTKHETQKAIDNAAHKSSLALEQEEKEKQKILTLSATGGLGLVVVFLIFVFNRLRVTKKQKLIIENQKQEVEKQKEVVESAHDELEEKNKEILDSINYAKRIQNAILPTKKIVKEYLKESFILYKPKDIIAGDFYWMEQKGDKILYAAADCTGHGVPGAMVSVVCNNALNRSVREYGLITPGKILDKTRQIVIEEFEKSDEDVKDGMDIALCSLDGMKLEFSGANNPLWIVRNGEVLETKANKQPIGKVDNPRPYTTHKMELKTGDSIFIFSDGYVDQFGGEKGKKLKAKKFRELLLSIQDKSMEEQKVLIDATFENWKGDLEQVDDVCVIGVRV